MGNNIYHCMVISYTREVKLGKIQAGAKFALANSFFNLEQVKLKMNCAEQNRENIV